VTGRGWSKRVHEQTAADSAEPMFKNTWLDLFTGAVDIVRMRSGDAVMLAAAEIAGLPLRAQFASARIFSPQRMMPVTGQAKAFNQLARRLSPVSYFRVSGFRARLPCHYYAFSETFTPRASYPFCFCTLVCRFERGDVESYSVRGSRRDRVTERKRRRCRSAFLPNRPDFRE